MLPFEQNQLSVSSCETKVGFGSTLLACHEASHFWSAPHNVWLFLSSGQYIESAFPPTYRRQWFNLHLHGSEYWANWSLSPCDFWYDRNPKYSGRFSCWRSSPLWCHRKSVRHRHTPPAAQPVSPSSIVDDERTHSLKVIAWTGHECKYHPEVQIYPLPSSFRKMPAGSQ